MDQHLTPGHRQLTEVERDIIREVKQSGEELGAMFSVLEQTPTIDKRWLSIARTHMQTGMMALVRAIAKPDGFC